MWDAVVFLGLMVVYGVTSVAYIAAGRRRQTRRKRKAALYLVNVQAIAFADEEDRRKRALERVGRL